MATITIENVPETFIKKYYKTTFSFNEVKFEPNKIEKDPTVRLQKLIEDPENTSYGPISVDDFISEMKKW